MRFRPRTLLLTVVLAGCGPYQYTQTTSSPAVAKPRTCAFEVLTIRPDRPFDELGVLEWSGGYAPRSIAEFRTEAARHVCAAGGDALLATSAPGHSYHRASIIRYRAAP